MFPPAEPPLVALIQLEPTLAAPARVTAPPRVEVPAAVLIKAPRVLRAEVKLERPVPAIVRSSEVLKPLRSMRPPPVTVTTTSVAAPMAAWLMVNCVALRIEVMTAPG